LDDQARRLDERKAPPSNPQLDRLTDTMAELIKEKGVNILDLFAYYDVEYNYYLWDIGTLSKITHILGLQLASQDA